jgi:hypothetical protein
MARRREPTLESILSDPSVFSGKDRIAFLAKLVKNIPKQDWQVVQRTMGTSRSEAFPIKPSAFWDHVPLPEKQHAGKSAFGRMGYVWYV